jgi:putative glycerol-1-phosphate prenyltransferase
VSVQSQALLPFDRRGGLVVLVDPGRSTAADAFALASRAADAGACGFLIGDSLGRGANLSAHVAAIREGAPGLAVVQFPASAAELSADVDAVLFLALLSGRNPRYLIEEQVRAIPFFDSHPNVLAISTAYLLIDGGTTTSVEQASRTQPLPSDDPQLIVAHIKAARLMGMHATYLEAGSGAVRPVSPRVIAAAREATDGPLLVGGGITSVAAARDARVAGADYVVIGTLFEREPGASVQSLAIAARS